MDFMVCGSIGRLPGQASMMWMPSLLPRVQEHPWSLRTPDDEEAILAAEEVKWDKKMCVLRQSQSKGQGTIEHAVEATEDDQEMDEEESVSDDFLEPNTRNESNQALDWDPSLGDASEEY